MKTIRVSLLALACAFAAHADFSYTTTRKGGPGGAAAGDTTSKYFLKGQKMMIQSAMSTTIMDFDAQTITTINPGSRTYKVTKFSDLGQTMQNAKVDAQVEVKETGQKKNVNGYNASEVVMTIAVDSPQAGPAGMKMGMEMDMWLSSDPPGTGELRAFYQRNMGKFPWQAMFSGGGNASMQKAMADMQRKMAELGGVPVLQVMKMKSMGNAAQTAQMQAGMEQARARLEEMKKQGGQQAQMAEQMLARMGAMGGGSGGSMFEITMESSGFSTASIPDSVFAVPAGFTKQ
ncbi:MAG: DUF4412 domain-containing protein [Acidobacteria bacterium]|nr:DUF4412 domain-containing protein [Acidobacteriota bacterium]